MSRKKVYSGSVEKIEVMDSEGEEDFPWIEEEDYKQLYKDMMLARKFDEKAFSLQRRGDISTYAPHKGQEAAQIGTVFAMEDEDWMVPSFRETAAFIARGFDLVPIFQRWMGDERGQKDLENTLPVAIPVGTQNLHTAGIGMAMSNKEDDKAVVGFTGDGSTSEGDFHEALNFAGVYDAHSVFIIQNNQYAISMPVEEQTNSETLAQKGLAYGMESIQVDGNDILAVIKAVEEALEKARNGDPVLIEIITYRIEDHTTSDDSTRYRDDEEVEEWKEKDPLERYRNFLKEHGIWSEELEDYEDEAEKAIDEAAEEAKEIDDPDPEDMFDYVYENPPEIFEQEKEEFLEEMK